MSNFNEYREKYYFRIDEKPITQTGPNKYSNYYKPQVTYPVNTRHQPDVSNLNKMVSKYSRFTIAPKSIDPEVNTSRFGGQSNSNYANDIIRDKRVIQTNQADFERGKNSATTHTSLLKSHKLSQEVILQTDTRHSKNNFSNNSAYYTAYNQTVYQDHNDYSNYYDHDNVSPQGGHEPTQATVLNETGPEPIQNQVSYVESQTATNLDYIEASDKSRSMDNIQLSSIKAKSKNMSQISQFHTENSTTKQADSQMEKLREDLSKISQQNDHLQNENKQIQEQLSKIKEEMQNVKNIKNYLFEDKIDDTVNRLDKTFNEIEDDPSSAEKVYNELEHWKEMYTNIKQEYATLTSYKNKLNYEYIYYGVRVRSQTTLKTKMLNKDLKRFQNIVKKVSKDK